MGEKKVKMTDYERLRILFIAEQKSIIETMDAMYYAQSIPELNSLKRELSKKTKTLAFKKEEMLNLYIDNLNAGVSNELPGRSKEEVGR